MCRLGKSVLCGKTSLTVAKYRFCTLSWNPRRWSVVNDEIFLKIVTLCIVLYYYTIKLLENFFTLNKLCSLFAVNEPYTLAATNNLRQSIDGIENINELVIIFFAQIITKTFNRYVLSVKSIAMQQWCSQLEWQTQLIGATETTCTTLIPLFFFLFISSFGFHFRLFAHYSGSNGSFWIWSPVAIITNRFFFDTVRSMNDIVTMCSATWCECCCCERERKYCQKS